MGKANTKETTETREVTKRFIVAFAFDFVTFVFALPGPF